MEPGIFTEVNHALNNALTETDLDDIVKELTGKKLAQLVVPGTFDTMLSDVILLFDKKGKTAELIRAAQKVSPENPVLEVKGPQLLDRLAKEEAALKRMSPDPFDDCLIEPGGQPFISRSLLRQFFREISAPTGHSVLIVNGLPQTGKSYSFRFVCYLEKRLHNGYEVAWKDLGEEAQGAYLPHELVGDLTRPLGWDLSSLPDPAGRRYHKDLTGWLIGQAKREHADWPLVIVLDGFHQPDLHVGTRLFIQELIKQVASTPTRIRLVLLNYGPDLLPPSLPPIAEEKVANLSKPEVVEFFHWLFKQDNEAPEPGAAEIAAEVVLADLPADHPSYNEQLNKRIHGATRRLRTVE
jgi:hypothetical protein